MGNHITVEFNHLDKILAQLLADLDTALDESAQDVLADAQGRVDVKTGATRASIYTVSPGTSTYADAVGAASGMNPKIKVLPEEPLEAQHEAIVAVADSDGIFLEYGTKHMPARPFLGAAAEARHTDFIKRIQTVIENIHE